MEEIINRVAQSSLISIDMDEWLSNEETIILDIKDWLFQGLILREKDFRENVKQHDWSKYSGKNVLITCSTDAIIPSWAYMILVSKLTGLVRVLAIGTTEDMEKALIDHALNAMDIHQYQDAKVVVKGCGSLQARAYCYTKLTERLISVVNSLMYGEPCSTVPVYKRAK